MDNEITVKDVEPKAFDLAEIVRNARKHIIPFIQAIDPDYVPTWYHIYIANKLMEFFFGDCDRLMISLPPQHGKSRLVQAAVAFVFGHCRDKKILSGSYGASLAEDISAEIQKIIDSDMYALIFPETRLQGMIGTKKEDAKRTDSKWEIVDAKGYYKCAGVGGPLTGSPGDILIVDDPHKDPEDCESATKRKKVHNWYFTVAKSRLKKTGKILIIQTRWHEDDLSGHLLKKAEENEWSKKWERIYFEAIRTDEPCDYDPREPGEVLWEAHHDLQSLMEKKGETPPLWWEAMYQQRPSRIDGSLFKDQDWQFYDELPKMIIRKVQFWDCAEKPGLSNDYSVCATYAETDRGYYLLDLWRDKVDAPTLEKSAISLYLKHKPHSIVIEDKSNGTPLIQYLKNNREFKFPIEAYQPKGDKQVRAIRATPSVASGHFYLPRNASWLSDFLTEHRQFPNVTNDDQVDTTSMANDWFKSNKQAELKISTLG